MNLPAYRITFEDGQNYVTSMSIATTLKDAQQYFLGALLEQRDGTLKTVAKVEILQKASV